MRLLLISNGQETGLGYLEHARAVLAEALDDSVDRVLLIPYASVTRSYDTCADDLRPLVTQDLGRQIVGVHSVVDKERAILDARAIFVRGGNTWRLVGVLRKLGLLTTIREAVMRGAAYVGWSAGANIACPTMQTTNDMPIVDPGGLDTLNLVPFQINPHYLDGGPSGFGGETREARILEYLELNRETYVAGMREGLMFRVEGDSIELKGRPDRTVRIFRHGSAPHELGVGADFGFLMRQPGRRVDNVI